MDQNPTAFRKRDMPESASGAVHQRQIMRDLLGEMHQLKDFADIDKSKKFTRSILFEKSLRDSKELEEYHFTNMKPLDDFIRPDSPASPRETGYNSGHIRSILKLDVYGPASSASTNREREQGSKPLSPNVDRHVILDPAYMLRTSSPQDRVGTGDSRASSATSTSYNGAFPSLKTLRRSRGSSITGGLDGVDNTGSMQGLFHSTSNAALGGTGGMGGTGGHGGRLLVEKGEPGVSFSGTTGILFAGRRPGTGASRASTAGSRGHFPVQTFTGVAITEDERMQGGDPFLRRTSWYRNYAEEQKVCHIRHAIRHTTYDMRMGHGDKRRHVQAPVCPAWFIPAHSYLR
jgi:hypothetical protein